MPLVVLVWLVASNIRSLQWSPDSKHILYGDRKNRLVEVDPFARTRRTVMENPEAEFRMVKYSPDSRWITYTRPAKNEMDKSSLWVVCVWHCQPVDI